MNFENGTALVYRLELLEKKFEDAEGDRAEVLGRIIKIDARTEILERTLQALANEQLALRQELPKMFDQAVERTEARAKALWDDTSKVETIQKLREENEKLAKKIGARVADDAATKKEEIRRKRDRIEAGVKTAIALFVTFVAGLLASGLYNKLH